MAQTMRTQCTSGTAVSRKAAVASINRTVARPFTAQRPASAVVRANEVAISRKTFVARAAAAAETPSAQQSGQTKEWAALVCNCDFFFNDPQNESVAEQLRERVRFFKEQNRENDFYIVPEPVWLDKKFPELAKQVKRPCVALISTDKTWITFMKLRLDRVLRIDLKDMSDTEVLAVGGEVPEFKPVGNWTAPYARYTPGWWNVFLPNH
ncbi:hypothetical protein Vafri_22025 [Volvox africanus]|uniref:Uncharacterized protein n=1 Tax=Volvox africanus TaxID=51714 RepID=A0A8J4BUD2_9CHLO|nr:hypothetical protein Vafri_22025 [Volvox africanus]